MKDPIPLDEVPEIIKFPCGDCDGSAISSILNRSSSLLDFDFDDVLPMSLAYDPQQGLVLVVQKIKKKPEKKKKKKNKRTKKERRKSFWGWYRTTPKESSANPKSPDHSRSSSRMGRRSTI